MKGYGPPALAGLFLYNRYPFPVRSLMKLVAVILAKFWFVTVAKFQYAIYMLLKVFVVERHVKIGLVVKEVGGEGPTMHILQGMLSESAPDMVPAAQVGC